MKNIEWLKEEINTIEEEAQEILDKYDDRGPTVYKFEERLHSVNIFRHLLDQLDEPEVLSQEWIERNTSPVDDEGRLYIWKRDLENLLVPKQEEQKVPKWFDEWCKGRVWGDKFHEGRRFTRSDVRALVQIADGERLHGLTQEQSDEISRDFFKYLDAFHYGYEVEEEQKYRVLDGNTTLLGRINGLMLTTVEILEYYPEYAPTFDLTEQEIKDYDERYFAFAVPVEELEE